ncbi:Nuclear import receptor [Coemansia aciculifera]|uniref:Nuclear import receptor n=1 Tax=Coemansia aciculifera TaxID=417176 RepID=A0A9W8M188_9FUNG|nr:Nuclear import receptor [Coemansia aciculifera]
MSNQSAVSEVISALNALYQGTNLQEREQANSWLEQYQKTAQAWTTSDTILGTAELGLEIKLFAAQTLRNKIINDFSELGEPGALQLRDSVVTHLRNARSGPQPLITQLCLSLADLAVQLGAWKDPFADMTGSFLSDPESVSCLLEFLAVLPEEIENDRILLPTEFFRQRATELLTQRAGDLIQLLVQCLRQPDLKADAHTKVLVCFKSWLRSGEITLMMVQNTSLIELAFAALKAEDDSVFETAVDAICGILGETRIDRDDDPEDARLKSATVEQQLVPQLSAVAAQMRIDPLVAEGNEERIRGYCRVLTEAGEAWAQRIVLNIAAFETTVSALVDCMRLDSLEVIGMMFEFWAVLADNTMESTVPCDPARRALAAVYETLIDVITRHLRYPDSFDTSDAQGGMTAKERDDFREFRHNIGDVLKDCVRVVGQTKALAHPYNAMLAGINSTPQLPWQEIEAPLFALRAMGAEVSSQENVMMPQIMDMFSQFPAHPRLRYAATLVIGRYTEWTQEHPHYVPFQLNYIAEGFKVRDVAAASAQSLKYLCQDCSKYLAAHWASMLKFYNEVVASGTLDDGDVIEFSQALAHVVSAVPEPDTHLAIEAFCLPIGQELGVLLQRSELTSGEKQKTILLFERMGVFLRFMHVEDNEPAEILLSRIINESWSLVSTALQRYAADPLVAESVAKFVRVLVEYYPNILRPIVVQVIDAVVNSFQRTGQGTYLWLARRILNVYQSLGVDESASLQLVTNMVERLSEAALALFQSTPFSDIPETTEDYFNLIERAVETAPGYIIGMATFPYIVQAAVAALEVNQYHAQMSVIYMWTQILNPTKRHVRLMRENRSALQVTPASPAGRAPPTSPASPLRQRRRSVRPDTYPVEHVVELCSKHGFDLTVKLMHGLMRNFDHEVVPAAADALASLTAIVSDGPAVAKAQYDSPPLATMCEWEQAMLSQIPEANFPAADKQAFMSELAEYIQTRQWPKIKALVSDTAAVFRRRNATKK